MRISDWSSDVCSSDLQAMLIESDPALYYRPAYLGPSGWIGIRLDHAPVDWAHVKEWLTKSWRLLAPRRLTKLADVADHFCTIGRSWNWCCCGVPLLVRHTQCRPGSGRSCSLYPHDLRTDDPVIGVVRASTSRA